MAIERLPLCSFYKPVSKDGHAGPHAHTMLPFAPSLYFFDGTSFPTTQSVIPQDTTRTFGGIRQPDTFRKDCCSPVA